MDILFLYLAYGGQVPLSRHTQTHSTAALFPHFSNTYNEKGLIRFVKNILRGSEETSTVCVAQDQDMHILKNSPQRKALHWQSNILGNTAMMLDR